MNLIIFPIVFSSFILWYKNIFTQKWYNRFLWFQLLQMGVANYSNFSFSIHTKWKHNQKCQHSVVGRTIAVGSTITANVLIFLTFVLLFSFSVKYSSKCWKSVNICCNCAVYNKMLEFSIMFHFVRTIRRKRESKLPECLSFSWP